MTNQDTGVTRGQWFFALATAAVLIALGAGLLAIGGNGVSLIVVGSLLGAYNSYSYIVAQHAGDSGASALKVQLGRSA